MDDLDVLIVNRFDRGPADRILKIYGVACGVSDVSFGCGASHVELD